jgi:hypothetical protein
MGNDRAAGGGVPLRLRFPARVHLPFSYRLLRGIYPVFRLLFPNQVIRADNLARAMVDVVVGEEWSTGESCWCGRTQCCAICTTIQDSLSSCAN